MCLYMHHLGDDLHSVSNCREKNMLGEQSNNFVNSNIILSSNLIVL